METIRGRTCLEINDIQWKDRLARYPHIALDLGTGDGRYAATLARQHPDWFVIGLDACRENLRAHSKANLPNLLFVIASAQSLPHELNGFVSQISINFPWGSLLESLLTGDPSLLHGLDSVAQPAASLELRLNAGALAEAGTSLSAGTDQIYCHLLRAGWQLQRPLVIDARTLKAFPSTWAKRLAFGRDPRAMLIRGRR